MQQSLTYLQQIAQMKPSRGQVMQEVCFLQLTTRNNDISITVNQLHITILHILQGTADSRRCRRWVDLWQCNNTPVNKTWPVIQMLWALKDMYQYFQTRNRKLCLVQASDSKEWGTYLCFLLRHPSHTPVPWHPIPGNQEALSRMRPVVWKCRCCRQRLAWSLFYRTMPAVAGALVSQHHCWIGHAPLPTSHPKTASAHCQYLNDTKVGMVLTVRIGIVSNSSRPPATCNMLVLHGISLKALLSMQKWSAITMKDKELEGLESHKADVVSWFASYHS